MSAINQPDLKVLRVDLEFLPPEIAEAIINEIKNNQQEKNGKNAPLKKEAPKKVEKKIVYNFDMVNCNQDIKTLSIKLKESAVKNYGMLLWGVSGSGKSYFAKYLAQQLDMPIIKKRASDISAKHVGETEANIKKAFKEAVDKKAILLLDEADSFLFDRRYARQEWSVSSVNEILTQMEDHPYPFIMTTNLKTKIDKAAIRRFLFKVKYEYMEPKHIQAGVKHIFGKKFKLTEEQLTKLTHISAGDFDIAKRKLDVLDGGKYTNELIFDYLLQELNEKEIEKGSNKINI